MRVAPHRLFLVLSVAEMQSELKNEQQHRQHSFTGFLSRVEPAGALSMVVPLQSETDYTLHQYHVAAAVMFDRIQESDRPVRSLASEDRCPRAGIVSCMTPGTRSFCNWSSSLRTKRRAQRSTSRFSPALRDHFAACRFRFAISPTGGFSWSWTLLRETRSRQPQRSPPADLSPPRAFRHNRNLYARRIFL